MLPADEIRRYSREDCVVFHKTKEAFGGLSNMAAGFPLEVEGVSIRTSEALYQACRFPHKPDLQRLIISERSPMAAKMRGKPFRHETRADWEDVRVAVMRWCLRVKLLRNWTTFSQLLAETGSRPIVEQSRKDRFWGAVPIASDALEGQNILGRLLMELRELLESSASAAEISPLAPVVIQDFNLMGRPIGALVVEVSSAAQPPPQAEKALPRLFDNL
jgi:type I restriction enzyme S subunit